MFEMVGVDQRLHVYINLIIIILLFTVMNSLIFEYADTMNIV